MPIQGELVAHNELVAGGPTTKHSHYGGGGGDVKSGAVLVSADAYTSVTFTTPFVSVPHVVATVADTAPGFDRDIKGPARTRNVTTTGFDVAYDHKTAGALKTIHWIATDVGN